MRAFWRVVAGLTEGQRLRYAGALGALLVATAVACLVPVVARASIDVAVAGRPFEAPAALQALFVAAGGRGALARNLWAPALLMLGLTVLSGLFLYLKGRWSAVAAEAIARRLKERLYDHLQHLPCTYHDGADTGDLLQRCSSDVETFRHFLAVQVVELFRALAVVACALTVMLQLDLAMTAAAMALLPGIVAWSAVFFVKVRAAFLEVDEAEGAMTTVIQENLSGLRVVRAFGRAAHEEDKFQQRNGRYRDLRLRLIGLLATYWSVSDLMCLAQTGLLVSLGGWWLARGELSIGTLYAFLAYVHLYLWPVRQMGRILSELGQATVALGRIGEVLAERRESVPATPAAGLPDRLRGEVLVEGLRFAYGRGGPVLRGVSFRVAAGQTLALLGPSGAGKSTLVHLLMRLYDYREGSIRLDGHELRAMPRKYVRAQIGAVFQEPFLYARSVGENIRLGRREASDEELARHADTADLHATIVGFPQGYRTRVGERGITLSGGQRQRVALARALVQEPALLLLDDALSAVDTGTEAAIQRALLQREGGRRTTIVVAHRLSTVMGADHIVVLDGGRVVQQGTHTTLLEEAGLYRRLWRIQHGEATGVA